jgi:predicted HTH transcriptional regulator
MKMNTEFYLERESKTLELKENIPQKNQLIKTCVAFANGAGGEIVVGVEDTTGRIVGITDEVRDQIFEDVANSILDSISPQVMPEIYEKNINGKRIVFIKIFPGSKPPYFIKKEGSKKGVYLRAGSSSRRADDEFIEDLYRHQKKIFFDEENTDVPIESLDKNLLLDFYESKYKEEALVMDKIAVRSLTNPKKLLATNAAILFFTQNPEVYIPESIIICTWFKGKIGRDIIKTIELTGPIPFLIESALKLLYSWLEIDFNLSSSGKLKGRSLIPMAALREALVNALIHRKYIIRGAVKVALYEDRLEIFSPGSLPGLMSLKNLGDGTTFLRNPTLAKIARKLRLIEKLGSGIKLIFDSCKKEKLKKPLFYEDGDFLKIVFYFEKQLDEGLTDEEKIVELGISFGEVRIKDLIEKISISRNTATRKMNILIERKLFERKGKGAGVFFKYKGKKDE